MSTTVVTQSDFIGSDPFAGYLFRRGIQPWQLALAVCLAGLFYLGPLALVFGLFFPRPDLVSSWAGVLNQVNFLFIFPAVGYFYAWQARGAARAYQAVLNLIPARQRSLEREAMCGVHLQRRWWLFGLGVALLTVVLGLADNLSNYGKFWYSANWLMILVLQVARFYALYIIINSITRHLAVSVNLNRIFAHLNLLVAVTETPQSQALKAISTYSLSFAVLGALAGLNLGLQPVLEPGHRPEYAIFVALYFILVPLGFFLPFIQARAKMVEAKDAALETLRARYQAEYENLVTTVNQEQAEDAEKSVGRLKNIEEVIKVTENAPSWPFELLSVYRLGMTVFLPFAFAAMDFIFGIIDRFFKK